MISIVAIKVPLQIQKISSEASTSRNLAVQLLGAILLFDVPVKVLALTVERTQLVNYGCLDSL